MLNTVAAIAGIIAGTVMIGYLFAGMRALHSDNTSANAARGLKYYRVAFAAAVTALLLELVDPNLWSLLDVASAALTGLAAHAARKTLGLRQQVENATARRTAREFDLPWVGEDTR